ncbi:MAG: hypothetical protein ACJAWL_000851 [Motiliproteus sp.]|jgi:hypothetical protein
MDTAASFETKPSGLPLDPDRDLCVLLDSLGEPLIFGMGTDSNLYLIRRLDGAWQQLNLSAQFGRRYHAQAFAAIQRDDGAITLAVSITTKSWGKQGRLYVAEYLSNQPDTVDWANVTGRFTEHSPKVPHEIVNILFFPSSGDSAHSRLVVDAKPVDAEAGVDHYLVDLSALDPQPQWAKVNLPHDVRKTLQTGFGHHGIAALWSIYDVGADRVVEMTTLPDPEWPTCLSQKYHQLPAGAATVALTPGTDPRFDDVYIGGDGICVYRGKKNTQPEIVVDSSLVTGVRQLGIRALGDAVLVWFVGSNNRIGFVNTDAVSGRWSTPQVLDQDICRFSFSAVHASAGFKLVALTPAHALELRQQSGPDGPWISTQIPMQPVWNIPPLTKDELDRVIQRHAPHLHLHSEEQFFMASVGSYLQSVGLWDEAAGEWRVRPGKLWDVERQDMDSQALPADNPENRKNLWLKIPDQANDWIVDPEVLKAGKAVADGVRVYLHAKFLPSQDCTDIQCWLFSPYNGAGTAYMWLATEEKKFVDLDPLGVHEGDWEHVTFRVDNYTMAVKGAYLSQHGDQPWFEYDTMDHEGDGRMLVYASRHGHANYAKPGRNLHPDTKTEGIYQFGLRNDTDKGPYHVDIAQLGELVSAAFLGEQAPQEPNWLKFPCRWGRRYVFGRGQVDDMIRDNIPVTAKVILDFLPGGFLLNNLLVDMLLPGMVYDKALPEGEKYSWGPTAPTTKKLWEQAEELGE